MITQALALLKTLDNILKYFRYTSICTTIFLKKPFLEFITGWATALNNTVKLGYNKLIYSKDPIITNQLMDGWATALNNRVNLGYNELVCSKHPIFTNQLITFGWF